MRDRVGPGVTPAPAAIVRAAAWPLGTLNALCDGELERARARLLGLTRDDPRFMRALAISHPALAERVAGHAFAARTKRTRHLETTLYRYLARAAWSTVPCDLWAGVTV